MKARPSRERNVALGGTIIARNSGIDIGDCGVRLRPLVLGTSSGTPVTDAGGTILGLDPLLGPLANNGGPTQTHALIAESPAINAGPPGATFPGNNFDQRGEGFPRVSNNRVDIGAYEAPPIVVILPTFTG